ncbi:MAG: hypothetical protein COB77_02715 [Gammaproteobacteria bacterium]|nr:MAG: hypothetical protein COB77_02715 [Gammaproteobacteria bacterium]
MFFLGFYGDMKEVTDSVKNIISYLETFARYRREREKAKILLIEARDQGWSKVEQRRSSCRGNTANSWLLASSRATQEHLPKSRGILDIFTRDCIVQRSLNVLKRN